VLLDSRKKDRKDQDLLLDLRRLAGTGIDRRMHKEILFNTNIAIHRRVIFSLLDLIIRLAKLDVRSEQLKD
jgi:hypothetical protein